MAKAGETCFLNKRALAESSLPRPVLEALKPPSARFIAAIDLGTKYSGYAFKISGRREISVNTKWNSCNMSYKTLTCVLMNFDGTFRAFGHQALEEYIDDDDDDALFFDLFKMELYKKAERQGTLHTGLNLEAAGEKGRTLLAMTVFVEAIKFLKQHLVNKLEETMNATCSYEDFLWVLTVPAIWDNEAKEFMRQAATKAGLVRKDDPDRLLIALEPEAAALFCRDNELYLSDSDKDDKDDKDAHPLRKHKEGEKYLVMDIGAGTLDTTAHQVLKDHYVREIHRAVGGAHGGSDVNKHFEEFLAAVFSKRVMDTFRTESPKDFQQLMQNFELAKRKQNELTSDGKRADINIDLPMNFVDLHQKERNEHPRDALTRYSERTKVEVAFRRRQYLSIPTDVSRRLFFEPVLADIEKIMRDLLQKPQLADLKTVFLVGGFADCSMLQERMRQTFPEQVAIITPKDTGLSVLKGAVMYGEDPGVITERIFNWSYGVRVSKTFDEQLHDAKRKFEHGEKVLCRNVFETIALAEKPMPILKQFELTVAPLNPRTPLLDTEVYVSQQRDPKYVDEEGCTLLGEIMTDLSPFESQSGTRRLTLYFYFGITGLKVVVFDQSTGECLNEVFRMKYARI